MELLSAPLEWRGREERLILNMYNPIAVPRLPRRSLPEPSRSRGDLWATVLSCTVTWLSFLGVSIDRQAHLMTRDGSSGE